MMVFEKIMQQFWRNPLAILGASLPALHPEGVKDGSQGLERSVNPWNRSKRSSHPEGMREIDHVSHWALIVALASLQDADPY
jgi:hypothetical protein